MNNLKELEKKYEELGKEIERLKKEQETVGFRGDPIFLLSKEEYEKYRDRIPKLGWFWWLKSSGYGSYNAMYVGSDGYVSDIGVSVGNDNVLVRPALRISNLKSFNSGGKNKIVFNGVTWVKIDENLYISELPIDFRRFDEESNNYETSEVRKFLLNWFEERQELN